MRLERLLGRLLFAGVRLSAILLAGGLLLHITLGPRAAIAGAFLNIGLICLMGTPLLRVVVSFAEYVRERDWFFVATTLAVLVILAGTFVAAVMAR
jgi:uncharacterized membrane protein